MKERFDDMVRRRLQSHESEIPDGLFDILNQRSDVQDTFFDNAIRSKVDEADSAVSPTLFDAIDTAVDLKHLKFDSAIRSNLETLVSPVPADMWQRIVAEKTHHRRPVAWWWVAAITLLLLAGGAFYLLTTKPLNHFPADASQTVVIPRYTEPSQNREKGKLLNAETEAEINELNIPDVAANFGKEDNSVLSPVPTQNFQSSEKPLDKSSVFVIQSNKGNIVAGADTTELKEFGETPDGSTLFTTQNNSGSVNRLTALSLLRQATRLAPGQLLQVKSSAPVIPCPTNGDDRRRNWHVDIYSSAFLLQKKIQDNYMSKNAKAGFDSTLHQQVSLNVGINLVKSFGENFLLKTGLQYNRINESFRLTQVNERRLVTTISVRTVIISPGDTVYIRDTSVTEKIGTAQYRSQNTYTQWDVPVIVGYEFGGENLHLSANAGIIMNIRSAYKGEMLADSTRKIFDINNYNGQPVYRKSVGFSLYAGLSIVKPLSDKTSLLIEPYTRTGLSNIANNQAWFSQKNSMMGLSIGLRYKLSGGRQRIY